MTADVAKYLVESAYGIHESGTKYYQVFKIRLLGTTMGAVITHWGKVHPGAPGKPRLHGQHKLAIHKNGINSAYNAAIGMKNKNGYNIDKGGIVSEGALDPVRLAEVVHDLFGDETAQNIMDELLPADTGDEHTDEAPDPDKSDDYTDVPSEVSTDKVTAPKSAEWGTW